MKKIILFLLLININYKVKAIENIKIDNNNLIPYYDINTKKYNYYTEKDSINIIVNKSKKEIVTGDGYHSLKDGINAFEINSNIYGKYTISVYKNYEEDKTLGNLLSLSIEGYDINFNKDIYEYDITINDEDMLNINYELVNDASYVDIIGNGNFNKSKNVIKIIIDNEKEYKINVFKAKKVSVEKEEKVPVKTMSYTKKEIVKFVIITISCTLIFIFFKFVFAPKSLRILN